ncbi:MAG: GAF domain-containing protein [Nitrospirae bacterium]|nr:GAF domain-containing protein [Nitrospirota bacterium]
MNKAQQGGSEGPPGKRTTELERRLVRHEAIESALLRFAAETCRDSALELLAETAARLIGAETLAVPLLSADNAKVRYDIVTGRHRDAFMGKELPVENAGLCGWVLENGRPLVSNNLLGDPRVIKELAKALELNRALLVPLYSGGRIIGGLSAFNKDDGSVFTDEDSRDLTMLANYATVILDNIGLVGQLHSEKAKLEAVLDGVSDGILYISPDGIILSANKAAGRYLPISAEDLVGADVRVFEMFKPLADVIGWHEKARPGSRCWELKECGQTDCPSHVSDVIRCWHSSGEHCRENGGRPGAGHKLSVSCADCKVFGEASARLLEPRVVNIMGRSLKVSSAFVSGDGGVISGEVMMFHDYTGERRSERQRERFAGMITSDLKEPLTSITGYCELMAEEDDPEKLHELNDAVRRNVARLARMIEEYQDIINAADSRQALNPVSVSLSSFLPAVLDNYGKKASEAGVSIGWRVDDDTPEVLADIDMLSRALSGVVENSVRCASSGGSISVQASRGPRGFAKLEVSDDGMDLTEEDMTKVFDWYFSCGETDETGGAPGLCLAKSVVEAHGGSVSVRSGKKGGAVFSLLLPAAAKETA